jgi:hypothetical protein
MDRRCFVKFCMDDQRSHYFNLDVLVAKEGPRDHGITEVQNKLLGVIEIRRRNCAAFIKENLKPCGLISGVMEKPVIGPWHHNIAPLEKHKCST